MTHHRPSCVLTACAVATESLARLLDQATDDIEERVSEDVYFRACRVYATLQILRDELERLADAEHHEHPDATCNEAETAAAPADEAN